MSLQVYHKQLESNYMVPLPPPILRVKCRVLKVGKCTWSRCHLVASLELQADWISVSVVYIWKSTQVTNNHVREFRSMLLPSRALRSNLENPWHSQLEMMRSTRPSNSICFFWINYMSKGKKVKLAFHAMVTNCCGNLVVSSTILDVTTCFVIGSMSM
jgi:hypothetical protein